MKLTRKQKQECVRVLREAAERLADSRNSLCCAAIMGTVLDSGKDWQRFRNINQLFASIFEDHDEDWIGRWWGDGYAPENRDTRIFALLLASEIVRTDSLP